MMILTLFYFFISNAFAQENQIVLYPGESQMLSISRGGAIEVETRGILKIEDKGSRLRIIAVKKGQTRIKTSDSQFVVFVIEKNEALVFQKLNQWLKGKVGPQLHIVDQHVQIGGKILTFLDWLELKDLQLPASDFSISAKIDSSTEAQINSFLKELTQKNNLPYSSLTLSPIWQVSFSEKQKELFPQYQKLLSPLGIHINRSSHSLNSVPMVEVTILATEIRRNQIEKLGVDWPSEVRADLLPRPHINSDNLFLNIKAFEQSGMGRILASPKLVAKSGESATFHSGGEMPIKVSSRFAAQVEWKKYGIVLKIKPVADYSGKMSIELECEVSMIDDSVKIDGVPGLLINRITSLFHLNESKTIALSGLIKEEWGKSQQGLPGIKDIPILNKLFGSEDFRNNQTELFFFVTPKIIE